MKKLVVFMLVALFLLGSFPMAFAEGDIIPLWDCDHSCGSDPTGWEESDRGCYSTWVNKYFCRECGRQTSQDVTTIWHHLGPFFGEVEYDAASGQTVTTRICDECGRPA